MSWKYNKSAEFLLPLLGVKKNKFMAHIIDTYAVLPDGLQMDFEVGPFAIMLSLPPMSRDKFYLDLRSCLEVLRGLEGFKEEIPVGDDRVCLIYDFPEKWRSEYFHFLDGKYSKFSPEAKRLVIGGKDCAPLNQRMDGSSIENFTNIMNKRWKDEDGNLTANAIHIMEITGLKSHELPYENDVLDAPQISKETLIL